MNILARLRPFVMLLFINAVASFGVNAGGPAPYLACVGVCIPVCYIFGIGAGAVAGLGAGAVAGAALSSATCPEACAVVCGPLAVCLSKDTRLLVSENGDEVAKSIEFVRPGDLVRTFKNGKSIWTEVALNIKTDGGFDFLQFALRNLTHVQEEPLVVTTDHGMIIVNENADMWLNKASHVQIGDQMISAQGPQYVTNIKPIRQDTKYTLVTAEGTVLASDVFVSTMCAGEIEGGEILTEEKMTNWRHNHQSLLKKKN